MADNPANKTQPPARRHKNPDTQRGLSIVAVLVSLAIVVGAGLSWRSSLSNNSEGSSEQVTENSIQQTVIEALTNASAFLSMEEGIETTLSPQDQADDEEVVSVALADFSDADWDSVPAGTELSTFSLFGDDAPEISDENMAAIQDALNTTERLGSVSIVFLDASTGLGISYNADYAIYGTSTFKGPYAVYICQNLIENGAASLDTAVSVTSTNTGSISIDSSSSWATSGAESYPVSELITAAIVDSDNDAYGMLRNQFDNEGYDAWIASLGVEDAPRNSLTWYPTYCSLSSAKLWANALEYFESGTDTATWLSDLLEQTKVSFIRDGIASTEDGEAAVVRSKAGWIADEDSSYNAVNDAGIVEVAGRTYLMCIFTSQPDCTEARDNVSALAAALFEAREDLAQTLNEEDEENEEENDEETIEETIDTTDDADTSDNTATS